MTASFFTQKDPIRYRKGKGLSYRWYDPGKVVLGQRMEDLFRFAVCYWHSFTWPGGDPFGGQTFNRPWMHAADEMDGTVDEYCDQVFADKDASRGGDDDDTDSSTPDDTDGDDTESTDVPHDGDHSSEHGSSGSGNGHGHGPKG